MRTPKALNILMAMVLVLMLFASSAVRSSAAETVQVDPLLTETLAATDATGSVTAILTYDHEPTAEDVAAAKDTGVLVHEFAVLPMLAVKGTPDQVRSTLGLSGLISAYADKQLEFFMDDSRSFIGADRVQSELGYDGTGVGVAVIDSGVDGLHPDIAYGTAMVQNVKVVAPNFFGTGDVILEN